MTTALRSRVVETLSTVGAEEVLVFTRVSEQRFALEAACAAAARGELLLDDEPLARSALDTGLRRVASPTPRHVCAGYTARSAAIVALTWDLLVVLGRRNGCLAGVPDAELRRAAAGAVAALEPEA